VDYPRCQSLGEHRTPRIPFDPLSSNGEGTLLVIKEVDATLREARAMCRPPGERNLRLTTTRPGDSILVSVQDSGPGISANVRERIFDPLFTTKEHGLGLGLAICKSIMQEHHGDLRLADASNGCVFEIILPATEMA
jgi:signal transduction histidine kinase